MVSDQNINSPNMILNHVKKLALTFFVALVCCMMKTSRVRTSICYFFLVLTIYGYRLCTWNFVVCCFLQDKI